MMNFLWQGTAPQRATVADGMSLMKFIAATMALSWGVSTFLPDGAATPIACLVWGAAAGLVMGGFVHSAEPRPLAQSSAAMDWVREATKPEEVKAFAANCEAGWKTFTQHFAGLKRGGANNDKSK